MSHDAVIDRALEYGTPHVCVTGGEPLAQVGCLALLTKLCDAGLQVSLETSGALDISAVDERVHRVIDIKTPDSGEESRNRLANLESLRATDQLKFVVCSRSDYEWSRDFVRAHGLARRCALLFSPSYHQLPARDLADWILADRLAVRFQWQLHKQLWGDVPGR